MIKSLPSEAKRRVIIGKAGAPHGLWGEVRVFPMTDFPERFRGMKQVYVGEERLTIVGVRYQNDTILLRFAGYDSREMASALTGRLLTVDRAEAVPLREGEYYTFDIIGLRVEDEEGNLLGEITDVLQTGSNDVYVVEVPGQAKQLLVPALKSVVRQISLGEGKMVVHLMEEMT